MDNPQFLKIGIFTLILAVCFLLLLGGIAHAQWPSLCSGWYYIWPDSLCLISSPFFLYYPGYGYFNTINGYLLGYAPFTPFLTPEISAAFNLTGIPTFPYFGSSYQSPFPYATLSKAIIPYARFDYPTYVYGSPDFYLSWILLQ